MKVTRKWERVGNIQMNNNEFNNDTTNTTLHINLAI